MKKIKVWIIQMMGFSQSEANAFVILLPLMLIVIISEPVYRTLSMYNKPDDLQTRRKLDSLVAAWDWSGKEDGKKFRSEIDVKKKNGIDSGRYSRRAPYIKHQDKYESQSLQRSKKTQLVKFDLNQADTTQLKTIYGIGSVKAKRIVEYRSGLGGFITFDQLHEVWGLDSTVVRRLTEKSVIVGSPGTELEFAL